MATQDNSEFEESYSTIEDEDSAHIFGVLRSQIYKDKMLACIREYCTNAIDEHYAAGKSDVPVKITMPTSNNPNYTVRDYGRGLSPEQVMQVYNRYGKSTKRGQQGYNGQLGLGSKSAYSYTDSWLITSFYDGKKTIYNSLLDDSGKGKIVKLFESDSSEPSGVEITIPVNVHDIYRWEDTALKFLQYVSAKINLVGTYRTIPALPTAAMQHNNLKIIAADQSVGSKLVMGNVAYPIDWSFLRGTNQFKQQKGSLNYILGHVCDRIQIDAASGSVMFVASREALDYRAVTVDYIASIVFPALEAFLKEQNDIVAALPSAFEKMIYCLKNKSNVFVNSDDGQIQKSGRNGQLSYGNKVYDGTVDIPLGEQWKITKIFQNYQGYDYYNRRPMNANAGSRLNTQTVTHGIDCFSELKQAVIIDVDKQEGMARFKEYVEGLDCADAYNRVVALQLPDSSDIASIFANIEPSFIKLASSLPPAVNKKVEEEEEVVVPRALPKRLDSAKRKAVFFSPRSSMVDSSACSMNWDTIEPTDEQQVFYVEMDSFRPTGLKKTVNSAELRIGFDRLRDAGLIPSNGILCGVRSKDLKKLESKHTLLLDHIVKTFDDIDGEPYVKAVFGNYRLFSWLDQLDIKYRYKDTAVAQKQMIANSLLNICSYWFGTSEHLPKNISKLKMYAEEVRVKFKEFFPITGVLRHDVEEKLVLDYCKLILDTALVPPDFVTSEVFDPPAAVLATSDSTKE